MQVRSIGYYRCSWVQGNGDELRSLMVLVQQLTELVQLHTKYGCHVPLAEFVQVCRECWSHSLFRLHVWTPRKYAFPLYDHLYFKSAVTERSDTTFCVVLIPCLHVRWTSRLREEAQYLPSILVRLDNCHNLNGSQGHLDARRRRGRRWGGGGGG